MPPIYHFTDVRNLDDILACAELRCHRTAPTTVDVGNQSIKANRSRRRVDCGPAGMVGDYVPFYYAPRSPMLLNIKSGRVDGVSPDQRRIVYLVSSTEAIYSAGLPCVFSDGNAATTHHARSATTADDLATHVDWPLMKQRLWHNTPEDGGPHAASHGGVPRARCRPVGVVHRDRRDQRGRSESPLPRWPSSTTAKPRLSSGPPGISSLDDRVRNRQPARSRR